MTIAVAFLCSRSVGCPLVLRDNHSIFLYLFRFNSHPRLVCFYQDKLSQGCLRTSVNEKQPRSPVAAQCMQQTTPFPHSQHSRGSPDECTRLEDWKRSIRRRVSWWKVGVCGCCISVVNPERCGLQDYICSERCEFSPTRDSVNKNHDKDPFAIR